MTHSETSSFPSPPQRPTAARVFGILNIVIGALGILILPLSVMSYMTPVGERMASENPALKEMEANADYKAWMLAGLGSGAIATIVLIVAGMGLYQLKPYGRTLSITYGIYGVVMNIVGIAINCLYVLPSLMEQIESTRSVSAEINAQTALYSMGAGSCLGFIYPVLLLYFMYRPNMVTAFEKK